MNVRASDHRLRFAIASIVVVIAAVVTSLSCQRVAQDDQRPADADTQPSKDQASGPRKAAAGKTAAHAVNRFVTSKACRECHQEQFTSWHRTYHRTMTQLAGPQSVVAPFKGELKSRGRSYELQRSGDEYWVTMVPPEWDAKMQAKGFDLNKVTPPPREKRKVVYTTGSHHMQTYWMKAAVGLVQLPWYYHIKQRRWVPKEDTFLTPPTDQRTFDLWNKTCIKCHAVGGRPGCDFRSTFNTEVAELGIACEACHGPGGLHVDFRKAAARGERTGPEPPDAAMVNPESVSHHVSAQICGQCHGTWTPRDMRDFLVNGTGYRAGGDFDKHFRLELFDSDDPEDAFYKRQGYWADGTCRTGGDEYMGLIQSPCYQRGELSCLSCHSMHDSDPADQLKANMHGNEACLQCHTGFKDRIEQHTHHSAGSSGSLCYNCHMPHTSYALYKAIRSHRVDSPSVEVSKRTGRPNACNVCHLDRSYQWTAEKLTKWYGAAPVKLDAEERRLSAAVLMLLRGDAAQRAIAAWHMGWKPAQQASGNDWQAAFLAFTLDDPYSAVRMLSSQSLKSLPGFADLKYDFLADAEERRKSKERVLADWRKSTQGRDHPSAQAILLDAAGNLKQARVKQLLDNRDDRAVTIPE